MAVQNEAYRVTRIAQYFTFEGRVRRMTFWVNALFCGVASFVMSLMFMEVRYSMLPFEEYYHVSNKPIYYGLTLVIIVRMISISVRRWQDIGKDGFWVIAYFYPILVSLFPNFIFYTALGAFIALTGSIVLLVALGFQGFVPGDEGENEYGPAPVEGQLW